MFVTKKKMEEILAGHMRALIDVFNGLCTEIKGLSSRADSQSKRLDEIEDQLAKTKHELAMLKKQYERTPKPAKLVGSFKKR